MKTRKDWYMVGIGGSVSATVRDKLYVKAKGDGISPAKLIGGILAEWVERNLDTVPVKDSNQMELDL